jgi:hypothetical protein
VLWLADDALAWVLGAGVVAWLVAGALLVAAGGGVEEAPAAGGAAKAAAPNAMNAAPAATIKRTDMRISLGANAGQTRLYRPQGFSRAHLPRR